MSYQVIETGVKLELFKESQSELIYKPKKGISGDFYFFENRITPCYPMQTFSWAADFWMVEKESVAGHQSFLVNVFNEDKTVWIQAIVYQYPWHFKEVFLTIPRGPICSFNFHSSSEKTQTELLQKFKKSLEELIKSTKACFIKIEPSWDGSQILDLTTGETDHDIAPLEYRLGQSVFDLFKKQKINTKTKFLQPPYSRTIKIQVAHTDEDQSQNKGNRMEYLSNLSTDTFFEIWFETYFEAVVSCFESKTRYNARLAKKKGLSVVWDKSEAGFEEFWKIMQKTSDRQEFVPYSREYYQNVLKNDWADLVLVKTEKGEVTNAWMGSFIAGMGMYLYGGSDLAFSNLKGAELIHTAAIIRTLQKCGKMAQTETGQQFELIYDMGGSSLLDGALPAWDGYSKFKKGFGGKIVEYLPHSFDVVYKTWKYSWVNFLINTVKPVIKKLRSKKI